MKQKINIDHAIETLEAELKSLRRPTKQDSAAKLLLK